MRHVASLASTMNKTPSNRVDPRVGLCARCHHAKKIETAKGSRFYFCQKSLEAAKNYPRYPRLPVVSCKGYNDVYESPHPHG